MHPDRQKPDTALAADSENPLVPADADVEKLGLIEHVPNERGIWQLTEEGRRKLHKVKPRIALVAFSTDLRVALWSTCEHVFGQLDTPITLCLTSPPCPLRRARDHGNPSEAEYVDFICRALDPIVKNLVPETVQAMGYRHIRQCVLEYVCGAAERFRSAPGFWLNQAFD